MYKMIELQFSIRTILFVLCPKSEGFSAGTLWALVLLYKDIYHAKNISDSPIILIDENQT
jgi:hypothetical protein